MGTAFHYGNSITRRAVRESDSFKSAAIIGAGVMGTGIAKDLLSKTEYKISISDISEEALEKSQATLYNWIDKRNIEKNPRGDLNAKQARNMLARLEYVCTENEENYTKLNSADIIWEVATEDINIKKSIFNTLEKYVNEKYTNPNNVSLILSNTSSHTTAELAELFNDKFLREKFLTAHGYFPFERNALFDVMKSKYTSDDAFNLAVAWADQVLEKQVIALEKDHHGYLTDPIFQAMGAIVSWDIESAQDLIDLGSIWSLMTANPFEVLDGTGLMPYVKSAEHMSKALPKNDRLRSIYDREGKSHPDWIQHLFENKLPFFKKGEHGEKLAFAMSLDNHKEVQEPNAKDYWSIYEAKAHDEKTGQIKSLEGLLQVAQADDKGGKVFRRYVPPIMLKAIDMVQDGYGTAGQVNQCTRDGLRFKHGIIEIFDYFIKELGHDGFAALIRRAQEENKDFIEDAKARNIPVLDLADLLDIEGLQGPREGKRHLLLEMKDKGWKSLLGYGDLYRTPVEERDVSTGDMRPYYNAIKFIEPSSRDRVGTIVLNTPLRGNIWNKYNLDQMHHLFTKRCVDMYLDGKLGSLLITPRGMRMMGADALMFNDGWFDGVYKPLSREESAKFTKDGVGLLNLVSLSPITTIIASGEKWGGGAEAAYKCDLRFDLITRGVGWDPIRRKPLENIEKKIYNQPEVQYGILGGFDAVRQLKRLGFGESVINEVFHMGMTATRAYQVGLSNFIHEDPRELLEQAYRAAKEAARLPGWSQALFKQQLHAKLNNHDIALEELVTETEDTFDPEVNPQIRQALLPLLSRFRKKANINHKVRGMNLPS